MNNFRQVFDEYKDSFLKDNSSVWKNSLKPLYCINNNGIIETSDLPYIMDSAEEAFVICQYTYTVIRQPDIDYFFLYMNKQGKIDNAIVKDGWTFKFGKPETGPYRSSPSFNISKQNLKLEIYLRGSKPNMSRMWKLFSEARKCSTQLELEYLEMLYDKESELEELTKSNAELKYRKALLEERIESYRGLLKKIEDLVDNANMKTE